MTAHLNTRPREHNFNFVLNLPYGTPKLPMWLFHVKMALYYIML